MKIDFLTRLALVLVALLWHPPAGTAANRPTGAPNVILIVTDDQGYGDMACHGNPLLSTPNLDQLQATSVRLEDYHVDPVCTPTRAALLTGRYCGRVGAWDVVHGRHLLHAREITMADVFRHSGYATGMFGKWHLGDAWPYNPGNRGFDEVVCHRAGGVDEIGNPVGNDYFDDVYYRNGAAEKFEGYCTDVFFSEAMQFIRAICSEVQPKPFFVYLPTNAMHSPFGVADKYANKFRAQGLPENRARFYGMIENFDENLGRLLNLLDEIDQGDNTIVIFMGDNGTAANSGSEGAYNAGMRDAKGSVYEGGHRVACFVRWPAGLPNAHAVHQLASHRDWLPTLIDLCELQPPTAVNFDGQSLAPLLRGDSVDWPERTFFVERQATEPVMALTKSKPGRFPQYAVLTERWRLVNGELYDIQADPGQTNDVSQGHPEITAVLKTRYQEYFADVYANVADEACQMVGAAESPSLTVTARDWRPLQGSVVWQMPQLARDDLFIQGYWPLEVLAEGTYTIEFARFPFELGRPMGADEARVEVGDTSKVVELTPSATSASYVVQLPAGKMRLKGQLKDAPTQRIRGPYYVRIRKTADAQ